MNGAKGLRRASQTTGLTGAHHPGKLSVAPRVSADKLLPTFLEEVPCEASDARRSQGAARPPPRMPSPGPRQSIPSDSPTLETRYLEIQAESGRRMRRIVAEHYGETE